MHHLTEEQATTAIVALRLSYAEHIKRERLMRAEAQHVAKAKNLEAQALFNRIADRYAALANSADTLADDLAHNRLSTDALARIADDADASFDRLEREELATIGADLTQIGTAPYHTD